MDDCCRISELLLGAAPSGEAPLTIAILTIVSQFKLSVSVVYTANRPSSVQRLLFAPLGRQAPSLARPRP